MSKSTCSIPDCEKRVVGWGYCPMHYRRFKLYGDPLAVKLIRGDDESRFWSKVEKSGQCWEWKGKRDRDGYGRFRLPERWVGAHRWVWESIHGPIADGLVIDHLCRNTGCVNPDHLEVVTTRENLVRGVGFIAQNVQVTQCPKGHRYDLLNTATRNGRRHCRTCERERNQRYREAKRHEDDSA